ncbi:hypothetical protein [Dyella nitratireducens]|uniref:Uncharacterized protein n=1 Tax=Dyella nitratireducens TaxID=1849580 RepID=A0ABQ1GG56_9GAMM|nr:hypothetical protein [Dyella nitratireducens]GGA43016.1 hypothetical protein GCM10010981_35150 [Dyella nitratireducens]GLQ41928.1 hypothetical protein GCM10007902_17780 [Dyella nitratireducens]
MNSQHWLRLAVTHLNVPVGNLLTTDQLALALRQGTVASLSNNPDAAALISSLFTELSPQLILHAAAEAKADLLHVEQLYQESLSASMPRVADWEHAVEHML